LFAKDKGLLNGYEDFVQPAKFLIDVSEFDLKGQGQSSISIDAANGVYLICLIDPISKKIEHEFKVIIKH
jgi:hypothetical protein